MKATSTKLGFILLLFLQLSVSAQQKRIYISNDDHTDYMWAANEAGYQTAILQMLDWWINYNETTATNLAPYRSKWNCDGSFWVSVYEKNRSAAQFNKLIDQIRSGQITVPYSPLIVTYGAVPAEAALRGMYYAGDLERRYNLDFDMAIAMYKKCAQYDNMIRLVAKYRSNLLKETHLAVAQKLQKEGNFKGAEQHYIDANAFRGAVEMYKSHGNWE